MSLTEEKIEKNYEKFLATNQKYNVLTEDLLNFLGKDLKLAPASTMASLHNAFEGGLIDHILMVTKYAFNINKMLIDKLKVTEAELFKVCFLHQIGKVFLYVPEKSEWHRNNQGKMYSFNEELTSMRVGERSIYYAMTYGVNLSEREYQAILSFDKPEDDKMSKWYSDVLTVILRQAIELAIIEEKHYGNK